MAFDGDPYRTLGLARGATIDEVKRAYRRLVKANHPDAAGSGGLARFLAIQAAYEQLVEGPPGPAGRPSSASRRASAADPDRADATRRAYGGRARARRQAGGTSGPGPTSGETPGRGRPDDARGPGPEARDRPDDARKAGEGGAEAGRRRGKATLGSTSYDDATPGVSEPDWSGASWYGTTSGTYWTINPKEYADPRKHGPEYQARARRATAGRPDAGGDAATAGPIRVDPAGHPAAGTDAAGTDATGTDTGPDLAGPRPVDPSPPAPDEPAVDPGRVLADLARALTDPHAGGPRWRVVRAVVGWLPVALVIGWGLGEITGCGRFAATCDPSVSPLILLLQGAALVGLLLAPVLASLAAAAAVGLLGAAVAATLVLSATGTAADEASRRTTLGLLLVIAWLAGLAVAIAMRARAASSRAGPVS